MARIQSPPVAGGIRVLSDHYNKLRLDILNNHDHSPGKGATVDHASLIESGPIVPLAHDHTDIDTHLQYTTDNPGGDMGVHGLGPAAYVAGSMESQLVVQAGTGILNCPRCKHCDPPCPLGLDPGYPCTIFNGQPYGTHGHVTFGYEFDAKPTVLAMFTHKPRYEVECTPSTQSEPYVAYVTTTGFIFVTGNHCKYGTQWTKDGGCDYFASFNWLAFGTMPPGPPPP